MSSSYKNPLPRKMLAMRKRNTTNMLLQRLQILLIFAQLSIILVTAQVRTLQLVQQPGGCVGGVVCLVQPAVQVIDVISQQIEFGFEGSVYVQLFESPTGYEDLYIGDGCDYDGCDQLIIGSLASADFEEGLATFENLFIREAGLDYTLKFIGRSASGDPFAQTISDAFDVVVGDRYQLVFSTFLGTAYGGIPFSPNPVVAIVDRGGNIITSETGSLVTAVLTRTPSSIGNSSYQDTNITSLEQLKPTINTIASFIDGVASFEGLYINQSGYPYQITFETTLTSIPPLKSRRFDVVVGTAARVEFCDGYQPTFSDKFSGEFFVVPPQLRLLDAGGNFVYYDNTSALLLSIGDNPVAGSIEPAENTFAVADEGIVTFNTIRIDKQSLNYTLKFTLFNYSVLQKSYFETPVSLTSDKFDVNFGPARQLVINRAADEAWSGLQAFNVQPILQVQDFGENVLSIDSSSIATATLIESLSVHSNVLIDTTDAPQVNITRVEVLLANGSYGAGHIVDIVFSFDVHLWVRADAAATASSFGGSSDQPYLLLNVERPIVPSAAPSIMPSAEPSAEPTAAPTVSMRRRLSSETLYNSRAYATASMIGPSEQTKTLTFRYVVQPGDAADPLEYLSSTDGLGLNGSLIVDGNGRPINTALPLPGLTRLQRIEIDTAAPVVVSIGTNTSDGEYGAGQMINFAVTFDKTLVVTGEPYLALTVSNSSSSSSSESNSTARFVSLSDDYLTMHFLYAVQPGDYSFDSGFGSGNVLTILGRSIEYDNSTANSTIVEYGNFTANSSARYRYSYEYRTQVDGVILRRSNSPVTRANYSVAKFRSLFAAAHAIVIDSSAPQLSTLYGVRTTHADGLFYVGEYIYITVQFTKPVSYFGNGIYLRLDAGPHANAPGSDYSGFAWVERLLPDNVTMEFLYIVEQNVNSTRLDLSAGGDALRIVQRTAYITRSASILTTAADLNTTSVYVSGVSLRDTAAVAVNGFAPTVLSVDLVSTDPVGAAVLYPDDSALIRVTFSAPIITTCHPVVVVVATFQREAIYLSGNGTDSYLFRYTVSIGDEGNAVRYRHTPDALCSVRNCPYFTHCALLANATAPSQRAVLRFPRNSNRIVNVAIGAADIQPTTAERNTSVVAIRSLTAAGEYGAGSVIRLEVTFSDLIELGSYSSASLPKLLLSIGQYAYFSGVLFREKKMLFTYITTESDTLLDDVLAVEELANSESAIECSAAASCSVVNQAGEGVDLSTAAANKTITGITIDPTAPVVTAVWCDKPTAPYQSGEYSIGEELLISVMFSKPVIVTGFNPRIALDLGQPERFAIFDRNLSSSEVLTFRYLVQPGDMSDDLQYLNQSIDLYGGFSEITRLSSLPTTAADVTLPSPPSPLALDSDSGAVIRINTERVPRIVNVTTLPLHPSIPSHTLRVGDFVIIRVEFSLEIIAVGRSFLNLNLGDAVRQAYFVGYYYSTSNDTETTAAAAAAVEGPLNYTPTLLNTPSNATRYLFYRYDVLEGDFSLDLEYVDIFALQPGLTDINDPGYIRYAATANAVSTTAAASAAAVSASAAASSAAAIVSSVAVAAQLDANLELPQPQSAGSLSADSAVISVDGSVPYITALTIATPDGTYSAGAAVVIQIAFSAAVEVNGVPSIKLETGLVDNHAFYLNGSRTNTLNFLYVPEPGDFSYDLDYHAERSLFNSAVNSFQMNGGSITAYSSNSSLPVDIWLNPPFGALNSRETLLCHDVKGDVEVYCDGEYGPRPLGSVQQIAAAGAYYFKDLRIDWRGPNYQLRYSTAAADDSNRLLTAAQFVDVSFSAEKMLRPERALKDQLVGYSVDIDGDIAVFGCPNCNRSVFPVQALVQSAEEGEIQREVQLLQTFVSPQPAIQRFHTTGDVGSVLSGTFSISHDSYGPSQGIPVNADASVMQSIIAFDLPTLGNVTVTREPYIFCACENAFTWTLTFHDITAGAFNALTIDASQLTSAGAAVVGPVILQSPALLRGTFTISALGRTSSPIPFDAGVATITIAVAELGLSVFNVLISSTTETLSRSWSIEFDDYLDWYDVPLLTANGSGSLLGGESLVFAQVTRPGRHGPFGISGNFSLQWRGNTTAPLPAYATAAQVKAALEALPVINFVNVNRTREQLFHGYTWTIEFVSVNRVTPRGLVLQEAENVEPIETVNNLIGNAVQLEVQARYSLGEQYRIYNITKQGTFGSGAGTVHIFQRRNETWDEVATVRGNDTSENNRFGSSVALVGDVLLVGAIGANMNGVPEQQSITCSADSGSFRIHFRGWSTSSISYNTTRLELIDLIVADSRIFEKLYTVRSITIDDWGGGPLCNNNTALITFFSPVDGFSSSTSSSSGSSSSDGADLELLSLEIIDLSLYGSQQLAVLAIEETQKGTWRVHGADSDPQQIGAAYVFKAIHSCDDGTSVNNNNFNSINNYNSSAAQCWKRNWQQQAQFFPTRFAAGSRFGEAVALSENVALVGAPGSNAEEGLVYVFEYFTTSDTWVYLQVMSNPLINPGDHFGAAVAVWGDTIVVGIPQYDTSTGGVFTYTRPATGGAFIFSQSLQPAAEFTLAAGDLCGTSVRVQGNLLAVGCPGYDDTSVHVGDSAANDPRTNSGAVFLYNRVSSFFNFRFLEKLNPSAVQEFDQFGFAVDLDGNNLIVSSYEDFDGPLLGDKVVVEITTQCVYNRTPLGGSFKIKWLSTNSSSNGEYFITRFINHDATADELRQILERDLPTGPLLVERSRSDAFNGGFSWRVTFLQHEEFVHLFDSDTTLLLGTNATVSVQYITANSLPLRGKAHLFQRRSASAPFVEQLLLSPQQNQQQQRCGRAAALSGNYALLGCPNRDLLIPNHNSGAAFLFHLGLLAVEFSEAYTVLEGNNATIDIYHDALNFNRGEEDLLFYLQSVDRNANKSVQDFIRHLFGIRAAVSLPPLLFPQTIIDRAEIAGKATARSQFYGSYQKSSQWVDGSYDYRAIADYVHLKRPHVFLSEAGNESDTLVTTADSILEVPDEYVVLAISSPGVWPSIFGRLYGQVRIYDPSDGNLYGAQRYAKLYDSVNIADAGISNSSTAAVSAAVTALADGGESGADYGAAVAVSEELGVLLVGAPSATVATAAGAGKVLFYKRNEGGNWTQAASRFTSPLPELNGSAFGAAVALTRVYQRNISIIAIGEPRINRVHVYVAEDVLPAELSFDSFQYEQSFTVPADEDSTVVQRRFGDSNSITLHGFLLVIAAPGLESCWVYRRYYNDSSSWQWSAPTLLRSSDYDFDIIDGNVFLHRQQFGAAVAASGRSIVIGAPFADYQKLASDLIEVNWQTEGASIFTTGRGKAYIYYSTPAVQRFRISVPEQLRYGQFQLLLQHQGRNETTQLLDFDIREAELTAALLQLRNVDEVQVSFNSTGFSAEPTATRAVNGFEYIWTVTFTAEWSDELPLLQPLWRDFGCDNCSYFSYLVDSSFGVNASLNASSAMSSEVVTTIGALTEITTLSAVDGRHGDRFGAAVAIDGEQIAIGAPFSAAMTATTWDFETGTLVGWTRTGDAFDHQPTFGDNSYLRGGNSGQQQQQNSARALRRSTQSAGVAGRYYIGTFEQRTGSAADFSTPQQQQPEGNFQGDGPTGTLSSDVFMIRGSSISFLIGGGCNAYVQFVELLVDGFSVAKHTGQCTEKMRRVKFDVAAYSHRAAQIRIVDNSSAVWGHINADDFQFDWDVRGATVNSGEVPSNQKQAVGGRTETPLTGAVHLYRRYSSSYSNSGSSNSGSSSCDRGDKSDCLWIFETKFTASDKRAKMRFGSAVAVNDAAGIVAVSAPLAAFTGFYKEVPSAYPHSNTSDGSIAAGLLFPLPASAMLRFDSQPLYLPQRSAAAGVWQLQQQQQQLLQSVRSRRRSSAAATVAAAHSAAAAVQDATASEDSGAVYVFVKSHAQQIAQRADAVAFPQFWQPAELAKLQPPDAAARDEFGGSLSLHGNTLAVAARGQDGLLRDAGAVYIFSMEFASLRFSAIEYPVLEGSLRFVTVTLLRSLEVFSGDVAIEFATSDVTAKGVDSVKFDDCLLLPVLQRAAAGCGDYEHTSGVFVIPAGDDSGGFTVRIMDDLCYERFLEFIQVTVSVPGSGALQGETLSAKIRIDDDDYDSVGFC